MWVSLDGRSKLGGSAEARVPTRRFYRAATVRRQSRSKGLEMDWRPEGPNLRQPRV
jgi:hypothetical protein